MNNNVDVKRMKVEGKPPLMSPHETNFATAQVNPPTFLGNTKLLGLPPSSMGNMYGYSGMNSVSGTAPTYGTNQGNIAI